MKNGKILDKGVYDQKPWSDALEKARREGYESAMRKRSPNREMYMLGFKDGQEEERARRKNV